MIIIPNNNSESINRITLNSLKSNKIIIVNNILIILLLGDTFSTNQLNDEPKQIQLLDLEKFRFQHI